MRDGVRDTAETENEITRMQTSSKGRVWDLAIPIATLLVFSVLAMLYVGGYWNEQLSLVQAFGKTDAPTALALGGAGALLVAFFLFIPRRIMPMTEFFKAFNDGVKSMVGASVILTLAWSISSVCRDYLGTGEYVARIVRDSRYSRPSSACHCHGYRRTTCFRHRYLLGNFRYSDPHRGHHLRSAGTGDGSFGLSPPYWRVRCSAIRYLRFRM